MVSIGLDSETMQIELLLRFIVGPGALRVRLSKRAIGLLLAAPGAGARQLWPVAPRHRSPGGRRVLDGGATLWTEVDVDNVAGNGRVGQSDMVEGSVRLSRPRAAPVVAIDLAHIPWLREQLGLTHHGSWATRSEKKETWSKPPSCRAGAGARS